MTLEDRINELEQAKQDASEAMEIYVERIEALEAALRDIMMDVEIATPVREFARAALAPEQDK